ncbi:MAG: hypothetical protein ACR2LL_01120 [Nitrosopumilus sp.]
MLAILIFDYEDTKVDKLSEKIDILLLLLPECNYSYERYLQIEEILQSAKIKLLIDNNYDAALSLTNLGVGKLFSCQQDSQLVTPYLLLFPILVLMTAFGLLLSLKKPRK